MGWIYIWMLRIPFEWFEFAFECFKSLSNTSNLHSNPSNLFQMVLICFLMLRIPFEWLEFRFECFESLSNNSSLHFNASNPFWIVRICFQMLRISFEWIEFESFWNGLNASNHFRGFKFAFKCFESLSSGSNLHSNASNAFRVVRICIRLLGIPFKQFEYAFECFECLANGLNLHSNASNPFWVVRIYIRMLRIPFEWVKFGFESLNPFRMIRI